MPANTLKSFFIAGTMGFLGGLLSLLIIAIFLSFYSKVNTDNFFLFIFLEIVVDIFCPFIFGITFLLPLAAIDKKQLEKRSSINLMKRYAPIITLPFGALFLYTIFSVCQTESDKCFFLAALTNIFCISVSSLFSFIRNIK